MPPWVSLSTQGSNVLLQGGLDSRVFSVWPSKLSKPSEMPPPTPPELGNDGGTLKAFRASAPPLFCFLFGFLLFWFYILDFCQKFKNKIFLKSFPVFLKFENLG